MNRHTIELKQKKKQLFCLFLVLNFAYNPFLLSVQSASHEVGKNEEKNQEKWATRLEYARLLSYMKQYDESALQYQLLIKEKPDDLVSQKELAKVYYYMKDYPSAIALMKRIPKEKLNPEDEIILADVYAAEGQFQEAEELYKKNLTTIAKQEDGVMLKLAEVLSWQKRFGPSLGYYKILIEKYPTDIQLRRKYAMVLYWCGDDQEAAKELQKTL